MLDDSDSRWTARWIRAEAIGIAAAALWGLTATHGAWSWFFGLFLVPDVSMSGYLFGNRAGAIAYNVAHMFVWPLALLAAGLANHASFTTTAGLSWIAHIAFDRAVGYGLKLPEGFDYTTLGRIGRARRS